MTLPPLDPSEYHAEKGFKLQFSINNGRYVASNQSRLKSANRVVLMVPI